MDFSLTMTPPIQPALNAGLTAAKAAAAKSAGNESLGLAGVAVAVASSAINKSAGATNRCKDVENESQDVKDYVLRREVLNIGLAMGSNAVVQTALHKPVSNLLKKVPEGYVSMMLTAPGLYLCEYLSREFAGKDKIEAKQAHERMGGQSVFHRGSNVSFAAFSPSASQPASGSRLNATA
jgi:hypothetical protein